MSRRRCAEKREIVPDPKYGSVVLAKFMNVIMRSGDRSSAESIVYGALEMIRSEAKQQDPLAFFKQALGNVMPTAEVRSRRVGGTTYQVPVEVSDSRRQALAIRWVIGSARNRKSGGRTMMQKLYAELMDAFNHRGEAVKKREDVHRMAEANRAFSHYRW